ncbi:MAG: transposase [Planctomycetota bacterium]|jgi:hypothetical protein|nr:transposase [Planctomycetota bacterium]
MPIARKGHWYGQVSENLIALPVAKLDKRRTRITTGDRSAHVMDSSISSWMKGWLWVAVVAEMAFFLLYAKRGIEGAKALSGRFGGVLVSERWGG